MRSWILSLVLLTAATAVAQPPKPPAPKPPAAGGVDDAVLNALRQHPDIKLAEAKVRMAGAQLEQAKSRVAQRIAGAQAKLGQAKTELFEAQKYLDAMQQARGSTTEVLSATAQFQRAKSVLVAAEVELNAAKGDVPRVGGTDPDQAAIDAGLKWLARMQETGVAPPKPAPVGTTADKLKLVLDRMVALDLKAVPLDRAMEAVKTAAAEPTLTIKLPMLGKDYLKSPPTATVKVEKIPFTAAVQLILDEINDAVRMADVPENLRGTYEVYVREYGLLIARAQDAPKDAPTLTEFARQVRAEKK